MRVRHRAFPPLIHRFGAILWMSGCRPVRGSKGKQNKRPKGGIGHGKARPRRLGHGLSACPWRAAYAPAGASSIRPYPEIGDPTQGPAEIGATVAFASIRSIPGVTRKSEVSVPAEAQIH